jgi:plastocyanin
MKPAAGLLAGLWTWALLAGAHAAEYSVAMANMKFGPAPENAKVGDTIEWRNDDIFRHTATVSGLFDVDLKPGARAKVTLKKAGAFKVYCRYHPTMTLTLKVAK